MLWVKHLDADAVTEKALRDRAGTSDSTIEVRIRALDKWDIESIPAGSRDEWGEVLSDVLNVGQNQLPPEGRVYLVASAGRQAHRWQFIALRYESYSPHRWRAPLRGGSSAEFAAASMCTCRRSLKSRGIFDSMDWTMALLPGGERLRLRPSLKWTNRVTSNLQTVQFLTSSDIP